MTLVHGLLLALVPATVALAQPKPALVQDLDQPARGKFQETLTQSCSSPCTFVFPAVPAGKRLVVTWVNAQYSVAGSGDSFAILFPADLSGVTLYVLPLPNPWATTTRIVNSPAEMYVEAGISPTLQVVTGNLLSSLATATLVGHLVSVP